MVMPDCSAISIPSLVLRFDFSKLRSTGKWYCLTSGDGGNASAPIFAISPSICPYSVKGNEST